MAGSCWRACVGCGCSCGCGRGRGCRGFAAVEAVVCIFTAICAAGNHLLPRKGGVVASGQAGVELVDAVVDAHKVEDLKQVLAGTVVARLGACHGRDRQQRNHQLQHGGCVCVCVSVWVCRRAGVGVWMERERQGRWEK